MRNPNQKRATAMMACRLTALALLVSPGVGHAAGERPSQQPVAGAGLCAVGEGLRVSGSGKLDCHPATIRDTPAAPPAPCELHNVRLEGPLRVDCNHAERAGTDVAEVAAAPLGTPCLARGMVAVSATGALLACTGDVPRWQLSNADASAR
ncbi:hypothetical protein [Cupriavidus sp. TMH.W2]|uniref:hypothetical protein n=1 Tax=Cupriavidus sp. TMH.W2 TaxID=3434465 RepID=UPI003D77DFB9